MEGLFFRQFAALFWKNWIILSKHKLVNLFRCILLPIGYAVFLVFAKTFLQRPNNYGIGTPAPIDGFSTQFDGSLTLIWADGSSGTGNPSANDIISHITSGFNERQMKAIKQVASPADIPSNCPQNFKGISDCYAGIAFNYLPASPSDTTPINYTISADSGLMYINVHSHTSDFETRILPLQLAIDEAFICLTTGQSIPTPLELPYTQGTDKEQSTRMRLSYIRGIRNLLVVALFTCYVGIAYQLPGSFGGERASQLTSHMKAMGLLDSARIISWHVSISLAFLPTWVIIALIWHHEIFTETNVGLVLAVHLLLGLSLASWSFFVAAPFGNSPQLAAVVSTLSSIMFAILAQVFSGASTIAATLFTLLFPPGYYVFAIRAICGYENHLMPANILKPDPDNQLTLLPIMIVCIINIVLWPYLGTLLERHLYDAAEPSCGFWTCFRSKEELPQHPSGVAISIRNLCKTFTPSNFSREKGLVTAISDLSLEIPKSGIFVLLGSNGAGKSTTLSIIGNLIGRTSGSITFEGGVRRPPRGMLGIVPQKNVLFPDLTCYQTLRVWRAIKYSSSTNEDNDYEELLRDCDLGNKIHSNANTLSGGQKRKLQLAIGLLGGSKIVLVDECTSGVDPLSRRALWRTLTSFKHDRTIVFTTHFLDEADFLADHIAILAVPGKLVAEGSPVALKTNFGQGYTVQVTFGATDTGEKDPTSLSLEVLECVRELAPQCIVSQPSPVSAAYHLKSKDSMVVEKVLQLLDEEAGNYFIRSVDVLGTSIEDIFLDLMESEMSGRVSASDKTSMQTMKSMVSSGSLRATPSLSPLILANGQARSPFSQALTIFYKRMLIARKSWLTPVLALLTAVCGACVPLLFLSGQARSCTVKVGNETPRSLYLPYSPIAANILESPPNVTTTLGQSALSISTDNIADNATFISTIRQNYSSIPIGGISIDLNTGDSLVAWNAAPPYNLTGSTLLNLATNILYNRALNGSGNTAATPSIIMASYASFPRIAPPSHTFTDLKWVGFFGAAMIAYPAFFSLYVSRERQSSVQAMQFSNGLSNPVGLWLGHLLWDSIFGVLISTVIIIIFATVSNQFYGLGLFWVVLVLYSIASTLLSYCFSLFVSSPLLTFAAVCGYQAVIYILYLASYLFPITFTTTSQANLIITIIHFAVSFFSPFASVLRSAIVSVNLFSILCNGFTPVTTSSMTDIMRYGGPILYLFVNSFVLFGILVWADSGSIVPRHFLKMRKQQVRLDENLAANEISRQDVAKEAKTVAQSSDALRVLHVSKSFGRNSVVDDVSFGVSKDVIFALLGPNGAGKTTTLNMIRGDVMPDVGDIEIKGVSVINSPRNARLALGVCPQFTAIDAQLTVREHLVIYGRLKGLAHGPELNDNVESLMVATSLKKYADRLASQLSGGNQRKLALAIALMGNPSVVLIDEFSTGIDAKIKRDMWTTLRNVAAGKAVIITTHSMEEASALANKVGILSKKMLAIGTTEELAARYATYQVHFTCRTREDAMRAQVLMSRIPGSRLAEDVATRFRVPIREGWRTMNVGVGVDSGDVDANGDGDEPHESTDGDEGVDSGEATAEGDGDERHESTNGDEVDSGDADADERPSESTNGDESGMSLARLFHILASQGDFQEYTVEKATLENVFLDVIRQHNVSEEDSTPRRRRYRLW